MCNRSVDYTGPDGIDGCLLLFSLFQHHCMMNKGRLNDLAVEIEKEEGCSKYGWQSAIVQAATFFKEL